MKSIEYSSTQSRFGIKIGIPHFKYRHSELHGIHAMASMECISNDNVRGEFVSHNFRLDMDQTVHKYIENYTEFRYKPRFSSPIYAIIKFQVHIYSSDKWIQ